MDELSQQEIDPSLERMYRRGYLAGFYAAGVSCRLPPKEQAKLERWLEEVLFRWSTDDLDRAVRPPVFSIGETDADRT